MTGDKVPTPKPRPVIDPTGEIESGSLGEKMLSAFSSGKGCSAIAKIMEEVRVEQRGSLLKQAAEPYTKAWTYAKDGTMPLVEVRGERACSIHRQIRGTPKR